MAWILVWCLLIRVPASTCPARAWLRDEEQADVRARVSAPLGGLRERSADAWRSDRAREGAARRTPPRAPAQRLFAVGSPTGPRIHRVEGVDNARHHQEWLAHGRTDHPGHRTGEPGHNAVARAPDRWVGSGDDGHPPQPGGASGHPGAAHCVGPRPAGRRRRDRHAGGWRATIPSWTDLSPVWNPQQDLDDRDRRAS